MKTLTAAVLLCASSLFGSADLSVKPVGGTLVRAGLPFKTGFTVTNLGPDTATNVKISIAGDIAGSCENCNFSELRSGLSGSAFYSFTAPSTAGTIPITATATSDAPDGNTANNTAAQTLTVSTDPDVVLTIGAPTRLDLALPLALDIGVGNDAKSDAHGVDVTVDFRADVTVASLPDGCINPAAGRIACHLDIVQAGRLTSPRQFRVGLVAPQEYGSGEIHFVGTATEAEHEFDAGSSTVAFSVRLYKTFYVTSTADGGAGSLRQAILDSNASCDGSALCAIVFRVDEPSANPWRTIHITSPLPALTNDDIRVDGITQGGFFPPHNPDGPDIEISGGGNAVDGLVLSNCGAEITNLAINGFRGNGISVIDPATPCTFSEANLDHLFVGTDPTGSSARPNLRGIGTSFQSSYPAVTIADSVISGNTRSGVFGMSGRLSVVRNRIGLKAHSDEPLPNGNAGVYVGVGGYGSDIGPSYFSSGPAGNTIAFNGQMGVAVAAGVANVAITGNRIWGNGGLGIDVGLDGALQPPGAIPAPTLTLAHYDPATGQTIIEGDCPPLPRANFPPTIEIFANDARDLSGFAEGQRQLGGVRPPSASGGHFSFAVKGDLTGQVITATATRLDFEGFEMVGPNGLDQGALTQTSEFSLPIDVR